MLCLCGDVEFQWDPWLGEQLEHASEPDGRLAMLDVLGELFTHASGGGQVVAADAAVAANSADDQAQVGCGLDRDMSEFL